MNGPLSSDKSSTNTESSNGYRYPTNTVNPSNNANPFKKLTIVFSSSVDISEPGTYFNALHLYGGMSAGIDAFGEEHGKKEDIVRIVGMIILLIGNVIWVYDKMRNDSDYTIKRAMIHIMSTILDMLYVSIPFAKNNTPHQLLFGIWCCIGIVMGVLWMKQKINS